jgi:hypothetical protein
MRGGPKLRPCDCPPKASDDCRCTKPKSNNTNSDLRATWTRVSGPLARAARGGLDRRKLLEWYSTKRISHERGEGVAEVGRERSFRIKRYCGGTTRVDHTKRNEQWHDDMHMYGSQLPRRLLPIGTTQERTHTNTYTHTHPHLHSTLTSAAPAFGRWEAPSYRPTIGRCPGAALAPP